MPTQTTSEHTPTVTRSRTTLRVGAGGSPAVAPVAPAGPTVPLQESGPERARREAAIHFRGLLAEHIRDMRGRGVSEDVLGPFERELLRLGGPPA